jgi:hypothetical protein
MTNGWQVTELKQTKALVSAFCLQLLPALTFLPLFLSIFPTKHLGILYKQLNETEMKASFPKLWSLYKGSERNFHFSISQTPADAASALVQVTDSAWCGLALI